MNNDVAARPALAVPFLLAAFVFAAALTGCGTAPAEPDPPVTSEPDPAPTDLPPVPTAEQLNSDLQRGLDPAVPIEQKTALIQGADSDPDIVGKVAEAARINNAAIVIEDVTDLGDGTLASNGTITVGSQSTPLQISFVAEDGVWKLSKDNACTLVSIANLTSAACSGP